MCYIDIIKQTEEGEYAESGISDYMEKTIFIACPISKYLTETGMDKEFENFIKKVYSVCKEYTSKVFLALKREEYGKARMDDHVCTPLDYQEMEKADLIIAIPEDSQGVAVELGWASAMNKQVFLILNKNYNISPLITALHTVTNAEYCHIENKYSKEIDVVLNAISGFLDSCIGETCNG